MADLFCSSAQWSAVTAWAAGTVYSVGAIRRQLAAPTAGNERVFRCTTAGTSGGSEPSWNLGAGATTNDNTAVWTEITGSSTYNTLGGTFSAPFARLRTMASRMAAGDRGFVLNDHAATEAASVAITLPGTLTSPCQLLSVNSSGALAQGASETTTGTSDLDISGVAYVYGLRMNCGTGAGAPALRVGASSGGSGEQMRLDDCDFVMNATGAFAFVFIRADGANKGDMDLRGCRLRFAASSNQFAVLSGGSIHWQGGGALAGGTSPAAVFSLNTGRPILIDGFDFSGFSAGVDVFTGGWGGGRGIARNCKMPTSWSGSVFNAAPGSLERGELYNVSDTDQNYRIWIEDDRGTLRDEATIVKTGGASDGDTPLSWRMATTADAEYPVRVLRSPEIFSQRITDVGVSKTITVDIVHDSVTNLTDAEIWIEVQYMGTSGFPLSTFVDDAKADVLATAADQASSAASWTTTGLTNPNEQKLEVTFTPQEKGVAIVTVCLAKASYTVYVDPVAQVA